MLIKLLLLHVLVLLRIQSSAVAFTPDDVIRLPQAVSSLSTGDADGTFAFFDDMG